MICHWGWCCCLLYIDLVSWLMLLPLLWQMLLPLFICFVFGWCYCQCFCGRCYCHWGWCNCLQWFCFGWCYCQFLYVADVIATKADVNVYKMFFFFFFFFFWLMLLPISGRCYNHYIECVGWWYCQVADGMATAGWRMVSGWCYYHWADVLALVQCLF